MEVKFSHSYPSFIFYFFSLKILNCAFKTVNNVQRVLWMNKQRELVQISSVLLLLSSSSSSTPTGGSLIIFFLYLPLLLKRYDIAFIWLNYTETNIVETMGKNNN